MRIHDLPTEADAHDRECAENDAVRAYGLPMFTMAYNGLPRSSGLGWF